MYTIDKNDNVVYNREVNFKGWRKMKLRSKETGEIIPAEAREDGIYLFDKTTEQWNKYELSLLAEYWEYCGEPKEFWYISQDGGIFLDTDTITQDYADRLEAIGNYFKTEEDAEKAVEKLKAVKRLKDDGLKIRKYELSGDTDKNGRFYGDICITLNISKPVYKDILQLLFGGEDGN